MTDPTPDPWSPDMDPHPFTPADDGDTVSCRYVPPDATDAVSCGYGVAHPIHDKPANLAAGEPVEVRQFYGPGAPPRGLTAEGGFCAPPVTGIGWYAPDPVTLLRQAADYLQACEGATLTGLTTIADEDRPVVFMGGNFPGSLRQAASHIEQERRAEYAAERAAEEARKRRVAPLRPFASVAYEVLGHGGRTAGRLARRLDRTFDFTEEDFD